MMAFATQYVSWLNAAAAQAEVVSNQASAVAAAFESALAATVQPAVVSANRALVQALAANNWLGQNTPAIADIEAAYEQMWASDVAAMSNYHADASAAVSHMTPWQQALHNLGLHFGGAGSAPALTANTQAGFHSGTGGLGFSTAGHGTVGILNSANCNTGLAHPGSFSTGLESEGGHGAAALSSAHYATGEVSPAPSGSGLLNAPTEATGGVSPTVANPSLLDPGPE